MTVLRPALISIASLETEITELAKANVSKKRSALKADNKNERSALLECHAFAAAPDPVDPFPPSEADQIPRSISVRAIDLDPYETSTRTLA